MLFPLKISWCHTFFFFSFPSGGSGRNLQLGVGFGHVRSSQIVCRTLRGVHWRWCQWTCPAFQRWLVSNNPQTTTIIIIIIIITPFHDCHVARLFSPTKLFYLFFFLLCQKQKLILSAVIRDLRTIAPMTIPAVIYLIMNMLSFYSLQRVDAATFSVIFQLKLVTTAFFSRTLLSKNFSWIQYRSLALVVLGVIQITLSTQPQEDCDELNQTASTSQSMKSQTIEYYQGVFAAVGEVTLSGLCTVYMEKMFKDKSAELTLWDRNVQLALASIPVYLVVVSVTDKKDQEFFHGWSIVAAFLAFLGAFGGIVVAMSLRYTDAILKTFATTGSIIVTTLASYLLLEGPMNSSIVIAALVVTLAVMSYQL
jgi:UDP-galactose transporter